MCDYSLHGIQNRLAEKDEVLVVHRFNTGSKGLTSPADLNVDPPKRKGWMALFASKITVVQPRVCAVCIPDGAKLRLYGISGKLQHAHDLNFTEAVTFRQLSTDAQTYRDAVEFRNGVKVRLQDLEEGQRVEVVALATEEAHRPTETPVSGQI